METKLDQRFSSHPTPTDWTDGRRRIEEDELFWISTVRADAHKSKYGSEWHFDVRDGDFQHSEVEALVFEVSPATAFGFGKGQYSQTRWRFDLCERARSRVWV